MRQAVVVAAEKAVGRTLREETLTWKELSSSGRLSVGRYGRGRPTVYVYPGDQGGISIGSFVWFEDGVEIFLGGNHRVDWVSTFPFRIVFDLPGAYEDGVPSSKGEIVIGHDVWIGRGTAILSGVHIGDGAVVGPYSVIARDVRPYAVIEGNPARELRRRFSDGDVERLNQVAWWNWPTARILENLPSLRSPSVDGVAVPETGRVT